MKIIVLQDDFPPLNIGGAGVIAFASALELKKRGHEVEVVTTVRHSKDVGTGEQDGLRVHRIYSNYNLRYQAYVSLWNPRVVREMKRIIQAFKPDIVHAHNVHGYISYASLRVAKLSGAKVILTCHDVMPFNYGKFVQYIDPNDRTIPKSFNYRIDSLRQLREEKFRYNPFRNVLIRCILRRYVDNVVAVSYALKDALEQNGIQGVKVIHNGIDAAAWRLPEGRIAAFKTKYALGNSIVLFSGKPVGVKGGAKLIEAVAKIIDDIPDIQILVLGREGKDTEILRRHATHSGLSDRLVFTGWLTGEELRVAYHVAHVVTVPSLCFDSLPTMILEAFACNKSVIATCFGGSREIVEDGISGFIINPFNIDMFARCVRELLVDNAKATRFGERGYARLKKEFRIEQQISAYECMYKK